MLIGRSVLILYIVHIKILGAFQLKDTEITQQDSSKLRTFSTQWLYLYQEW
jgi:hypothetical protein